ncbi:major facilitator superfamily domain-containing protein [Thelonectria olida]|uniref:Major facilitator superfamily domain-containing protein n=1 Tax=Thelonectria olida TaxID=1576542 RepID=A0A9P9AT87_9HYPO|nr:major facilitator superfamily domain-containing protein [Thelonectria olida]
MKWSNNDNSAATTDTKHQSANLGADQTETCRSIPLDQVPTRREQSNADQSVLADPENMPRVSSGPAYSVFSKSTRRWIMALVVAASFVSPMTANIYFPALNPISESLGVSTSLINLTLTSYMIFQGLSPTVFGDFGDMAGRRPAYISAMLIYVCANVGLALQRNYVALLVLRCLQSVGSSGTLVLGFAVVADISSTAERGKYMGFVGAGINIGPALGPVLGGVLSQYLGWPAIFWFCAIFSFLWLIPWVLTAPETCRNVVRNGSVRPPRWNRPLLDLFHHQHEDTETAEGSIRQLRFPNPLKTLGIIFEKEMALILFANSIIYLAFILVAATLGTLFKEIYGYNDLEVGLCYLPYGAGCCGAVIVQGYILDWNYRRIAKNMGFPIDRKRGDNLAEFPIETARIQPVYPMLLLGIGSLIGYGWALQVETSVAVPLVLVFMTGALIPTSFSILGTLIVDLHPNRPATATSANNLVRCLLGAAATAAIDKMIDGMGRGWCFTFLALLTLALMPLLRLIDKRGLSWRAARAKEEGIGRV